MRDLELAGIFFAIGHEPATPFLGGQLELDTEGYIVTTPGSTTTSVQGGAVARNMACGQLVCFEFWGPRLSNVDLGDIC